MKWPVRQLLVVLALAATAYAVVLFGAQSDLGNVLSRLVSTTGLGAALLCLCSYVLRGMRWWLWMAHFGRKLPWPDGLRLYLCGYTFTPTPGNIGEAARGLLLARQPLSAAQSLSIYGAERLADLLALLLLSLPAALWLVPAYFPAQAGRVFQAAAFAALLAGGVALLVWHRRDGWRARWPWLDAAWACLTERPARWISLTLVAWALQGLAVWGVCHASGLPLELTAAVSAYALAMVGGALSLLPAGLGGMEAIFTGLLTLHGATLALALAVTVQVRLLTLWLAVAVGATALLYSAAFRRDIRWR